MSRIEAIISEVGALTTDERAVLLRLLVEQASVQADDDAITAQHGLAAWTESTRGEDWSPFYPDDLKQESERHP